MTTGSLTKKGSSFFKISDITKKSSGNGFTTSRKIQAKIAGKQIDSPNRELKSDL